MKFIKQRAINLLVIISIYLCCQIHLTNGEMKCGASFRGHACAGGVKRSEETDSKSTASRPSVEAAERRESDRDETSRGKDDGGRELGDGSKDAQEPQQVQSSGTESRLRKLLEEISMLGRNKDESVQRDAEKRCISKDDWLLLKRIFAED